MNQVAPPSIESKAVVPMVPAPISTVRSSKKGIASTSFRFTSYVVEEESAYRQAELFYLQKQIQSQTPMVIVLTDGEKLEGVIEWYDRRALKVRGREKTLVYKSAIKYMYKVGESA
jgi:RNA chaperone Hfq